MFKYINIFWIFFALQIVLFSADRVHAQDNKTNSLRSAEVIGAKAALEDMLVRRYSQELSSIISHEYFSMGARLDLVTNEIHNNKKRLDSQDLYTELDLGHLDADTLFASYSNFGSSNFKNPLEKYSVSKIEFKVGLVPDLGDGIKKIVNEWLQERVREEFGAIGSSRVQFIQDADSVQDMLNPDETGAPNAEGGTMSLASKGSARDKNQKSLMDKLKELQNLAGHLILAISILMGVLLWRILMGKGGSSQHASDSGSTAINIENKTESPGKDAADIGQSVRKDEEALYVEKNIQLTEQIKSLSPKITQELQNLVTQWCERGEEGYLQLACFAEISGSVLGTLPIPKEHREQMGEVFSKMHNMTEQERHDVVNKTYWDIVASVNLGSDTLRRPFSFVGSSSVGTVSKVLLNNSANIQAVVSTYMPDLMRKNYFEKLDAEAKLEVLKTAAQMSTITKTQLEKIEKDIAPYFETKVDESEISMSSAFNKIVEIMNIIDACSILPQITGAVVEEYKRTHAHIGFIGQWLGLSSEILFRRASNQEITALIRVFPDSKDAVLAALSPLAKKVILDDLNQDDTMSLAEKEKQLTMLNRKLENLVKRGEIVLDDVFPKTGDEGESLAA